MKEKKHVEPKTNIDWEEDFRTNPQTGERYCACCGYDLDEDGKCMCAVFNEREQEGFCMGCNRYFVNIRNHFKEGNHMGVSSNQQSNPKDITPNLAEYKSTLLEKIKGMKKEIPSSKELEKIYKLNGGNVSREEIFEAEVRDISGFNQALDQIESIIGGGVK